MNVSIKHLFLILANMTNVKEISSAHEDVVTDRNFFLIIGIGIVAGLAMILLIMLISILYVRR